MRRIEFWYQPKLQPVSVVMQGANAYPGFAKNGVTLSQQQIAWIERIGSPGVQLQPS